MNVIQRPRAREFCATMQDYIIDTDVTIAFAVKYGGKKYLMKSMCRMLTTGCGFVDWASSVSWHCGACGAWTMHRRVPLRGRSLSLSTRQKTRRAT